MTNQNAALYCIDQSQHGDSELIEEVGRQGEMVMMLNLKFDKIRSADRY